MQIRTFALALTTVAALSACGSSKDASKANFAKAIDAYYAANCTMVDVPIGTRMLAKFTAGGFPVSIADTANTGHPDQNLDAPFEALEKAGLLTSKATEVVRGPFGVKAPGKEYSLTDAGTKYLAKPGRSAFCVGHRKVDEVVQFSEPGSAMGQTVSRATYTYSVADAPAWVSDPGVQAAYPDLAEIQKPKQEAHTVMVLMNDGWVAQPSAF